MIEKSNYREYIREGMKVCLVVEELVGERVQLFAHGKDGDTTFVGYTIFGTATFLIIDKTRGTGRKTQLVDSLAVNSERILYITPYSGPPKV